MSQSSGTICQGHGLKDSGLPSVNSDRQPPGCCLWCWSGTAWLLEQADAARIFPSYSMPHFQFSFGVRTILRLGSRLLIFKAGAKSLTSPLVPLLPPFNSSLKDTERRLLKLRGLYQGQWGGSRSSGICYQPWCPGFDFQKPHGGRREMISPSYPLTPTQALWPML